jgi:CHAT domain-containing protein
VGGDAEDLAKAQRKMAIDGRFVAAIQQVVPGRVTKELVEELRAILHEYALLHQEGPPTFAFYTPADVMRQIADTTEWIARAHDSLGDAAQAALYYSRAAEVRVELGEGEEAERLRAKAAEVTATHVQDIDSEIRRLQAAVAAATPGTPERGLRQVELGELYSRAGDDFEAARVLLEAEEHLRQAGHRPPSPEDLDRASEETVAGLASGTMTAGQTSFERSFFLSTLYLRLYVALAQAYRDSDAERARAYEARAREARAGVEAGDKFVARLGGSATTGAPAEGAMLAGVPDIVQLRIELDALATENDSRPSPGPRDDLLARALELERAARSLGQPDMIGASLLRRADVLIASGRLDEAIEPLDAAREALGDARRQDLQVTALARLAEIHAAEGRWPEVDAVCREGIAIVESFRYRVTAPYLQSAYLRSRIGLYSFGVRAAYELGDLAGLLERAELSKSRAALGYAAGAPPEIDEDQVREEFRVAADEVSEAERRGQVSEEALQKRRMLWDLLSISRFGEREGQGPAGFDLSRVQAALDPDEAVLYHYWLDRLTLLVVTVDRDGAVPELHTLQAEERAGLEEFARLVFSLAEKSNVLDEVTRYSSLLLPTSEEAVRRLDGKTRLVVSPHRLLHAVPFAALDWQGERLIRRFAVSYVPNLTSLTVTYDPPSERSPVLALGIHHYEVPAWPVPLSPLKAAEPEAIDVRDLYETRGHPVTLLLGPEATQGALEELDRGGSLREFGTLHLATHGYNVSGDTPMESHLFLQNAPIDGLEIAEWRLGADLVVLSSCSSGQRAIAGRGMEELPGDELFGLQAAFFAAGARRILACLWAVDSRAAKEISTAFHGHVADGQKPEVALQSAQLDYLESASPLTRGVHYWAPFILSGLGRRTRAGEDGG